ncbi:MAG: 5-aminolevulinate synthase [Pseudomonadota bacterium]
MDQQKAESIYREFTPLIGDESTPFPSFLGSDGRKVVTFCSNDYLAMSRSPRAISAARKALELEGVGAGGSRNIGGTRKVAEELEAELASLHVKDAALIFNSGYLANFVPMKVISKRFNAIVFSDQQNHRSIIDGLDTYKAGVDKHIFQHNDVDDLRRLLKQHCRPDRPAVVIFESLYSMEGDFSPLAEIVTVSKEYGASVFLNEVHAVGVMGDEGGGVSSASEVLKDLDLVIGTFGKGYGTVGGYIAGQSDIVDAIRCFGSGLIFTTALPPFLVAATLTNVRHLRESSHERTALIEKSDLLKKRLAEFEIPILFDCSHILAAPIGDERATLEISAQLFDAGYYVTPMRYPTVPRGDGRLRLTVTPAHTDTQIEQFAKALAGIYARVVL